MLTNLRSVEYVPSGFSSITIASPKKWLSTLLNAVTKSGSDRPREASYLSAIAVPDSVEDISMNICERISHSALW